MADEQIPLTIDAERMRKLGSELRGRFAAYDKARQSVEEQWLRINRRLLRATRRRGCACLRLPGFSPDGARFRRGSRTESVQA